MNWKPIDKNDEDLSRDELQLIVKLLALAEILFEDLGFTTLKIQIKEAD